MYDFWYTLGTAVMFPDDLLTAVDAVPAQFTLLKERLIVEVDADENTTALRRNTRTAGLLEQASTDDLRKALGTFIRTKNAASPPVSIYTAGRLSQFVTIPSIQFSTVIHSANTAYTAAVSGFTGTLPPTFPAVLGVCLVDGTLVALIQNPLTDSLNEFMVEFGISTDPQDAVRLVINAFVSDPAFTTATGIFLSEPDATPWIITCAGEQYFFWPDKNERAII